MVYTVKIPEHLTVRNDGQKLCLYREPSPDGMADWKNLRPGYEVGVSPNAQFLCPDGETTLVFSYQYVMPIKE